MCEGLGKGVYLGLLWFVLEGMCEIDKVIIFEM